jgi:hypothetical protein
VDEPGPPEAPLRARRANGVVVLVFVLWLVALPSPWWAGTNHTEGAAPFTVAYHLWDHPDPSVDGVRGDLVRVTALLALVPLPLLFVRLAGNSIRHEPRSWRRDVGIAGTAMLGALVSVTLWSVELPFLGQTTFPTVDGIPAQRIDSYPAFGWWLGLLCVGLLSWAWRLARPQTEK